MPSAVIDASAAAKFIIPDKLTDRATRVFADHDLAAPDLFTAELANTLWKYIRSDLMPLDSAKLGHQHVMSAVTITANTDLVDRALGLSAELQHSAYDCFYVALAERENCPLITADKKLMSKLKTLSTMTFLSLYEY